ncbi:NAD(P)-binding protein [Amniculicola lignicola CBS 123094]|uniref:NAD(P)-binding protein n=1 Tax=Amniculicola lignicola CBS 123094 TaxID=1392246 RepID=A0A6A5W352_9PLEO|nr:NAD(P)-binding protein [Amniculicola lignicola CBS 123094]
MTTQYAKDQSKGSKNHIKNIAIVGGGGQIGTWIVDALLQKGTFNVTAVSREGSTNTPAKGVHIASINYDDHSSIVSALKGQDALIITMSVRAPPDQQQKLIRAAAEAGVPWVLPNEFGGDGTNEKVGKDIMIYEPKKKDRELIESLGVSDWIGITCSFWYEYSLSGPGPYGIDIANGEVVWFDDGNQKLNTSTWPQTGRAVASLLSLPVFPEDENDKALTISSYKQKFVYISSFGVTQHEMFDSVKRVTGTDDSAWAFSSVPSKQRFEENKAKMIAGDRMGFLYMLYTRVFFPGEDAAYYENTHELDNEKLGLPKEDLDTFTKKAVELSERGYWAKLFASG